jgi:hypothetical protein
VKRAFIFCFSISKAVKSLPDATVATMGISKFAAKTTVLGPTDVHA